MSTGEKLLAIVAALWFMICAAILIDVAQSNAQPCERSSPESWRPPNVQLCPDDMDLWNCVRTAAYRSDM